jgi:phosphoglycerol transferase MdoB-like AlkP superfamily enzyme
MQFLSYMGIFRRPALLAAAWLVALSLSRLVLVVLHWDRVAPTHGFGIIFLQGLRFDLILVAALFGPVFLLRPWLHAVAALRSVANGLFPLYLAVATALSFFVEASTAAFIGQFDSRPNYLFVEYLQYPREVLTTVAATKPLQLVVFVLAALGLAVFTFRWLRCDPFAERRVSPWFSLLAFPFTVVLVFALIRSTTDHRPVNPSNAAFSQDSMVNQLPLNSPYSVLHAVYERRKEAANARVGYGRMDDAEVQRIVLREAGIAADQQLDPDNRPSLHRQVATYGRERPLNLVIVLMESLGAEFVGSLGGKDLTPHLDSLRDESIWFERLYATGIRSARGIEAVVTGFTPSPRTNVVKRSDTQSDFFTIATLLADHGYDTSFIYGGQSNFDNMRRFLMNNGFRNFIDENDFEAPFFKNSWGVSDEDLFERAHAELQKKTDQPFFALIFTTSHHEPFDIPAGRVEPSEYGPRETSIRYADWALGRFLELARNSDFWADTVFMAVADHNAKIFGGRLVPVERFRIPGAIFGPTIEPRRIPGISSQIDIVPTLLSLVGLDSVHPAIGRDLTRPDHRDGAGRAMMQFHYNQAFLEGDRVVVLQPDLDPTSLRVGTQGDLIEDPDPDPERVRKALAHALWAPLMIRQKAYRY